MRQYRSSLSLKVLLKLRKIAWAESRFFGLSQRENGRLNGASQTLKVRLDGYELGPNVRLGGYRKFRGYPLLQPKLAFWLLTRFCY